MNERPSLLGLELHLQISAKVPTIEFILFRFNRSFLKCKYEASTAILFPTKPNSKMPFALVMVFGDCVVYHNSVTSSAKAMATQTQYACEKSDKVRYARCKGVCLSVIGTWYFSFAFSQIYVHKYSRPLLRTIQQTSLTASGQICLLQPHPNVPIGRINKEFQSVHLHEVLPPSRPAFGCRKRDATPPHSRSRTFSPSNKKTRLAQALWHPEITASSRMRYSTAGHESRLQRWVPGLGLLGLPFLPLSPQCRAQLR